MTTYVWRDGLFYEKGKEPNPKANWGNKMYKPTVNYISPITGKEITDRGERREDLKRSGCREVDPSEFKPTYSEKFMQKHGIKGE